MTGFYAGRSHEGSGRQIMTADLAALDIPRRRRSSRAHRPNLNHPRNLLIYDPDEEGEEEVEEEEDSDFENHAIEEALDDLSLTRHEGASDDHDDDEFADNHDDHLRHQHQHQHQHRRRSHRNSTSSLPSTRVAPIRVLQSVPTPELAHNETYLLPASAYRIYIRRIDAPGFSPRGFRAVIPLCFTSEDLVHALRLPSLSSAASSSSVGPSSAAAAAAAASSSSSPRTRRGLERSPETGYYQMVLRLETGQAIGFGGSHITLGQLLAPFPARPITMSIRREAAFR
ncbi:MAG: hypothetical protein M1816_000766 [Peltula sp. TS41687]|nr:MAG: hypothetical protein M1816_000766 [Peltula sp. TS41687]